MSFRFLARSAAFLAAATTVAGCSHVVGSEPDTGPTQPTAAPAAESPLARSHRVTAITYSPARRQEALAQGSGAFCAPFDSIPAVTHPRFLASVHAKLPRNEPVVALELVGAARAYPVRYLVYHEIVNDVVDGHPVVVTFCPLCDSAAAHSRRVGNRILTFGVSGQLEYLNLVMFDRHTLSRWQQITGEAVGGELEGRRLAPLPAQLVSFGEWRAEHPAGLVMRAPKPEEYRYGLDPYGGYDSDPAEQSPLLRSSANPEGQKADARLPPKWRVVGVATRDGSVAFAVPARSRRPVVETARLGSLPLLAFFRFGTAQAEQSERLASAPKGWSATVWSAWLDGRRLHFRVVDGRFVETRTGSVFNFFGRGRSGSLAGRKLEAVPQASAFWFAWSHFHPDTAIRWAGG